MAGLSMGRTVFNAIAMMIVMAAAGTAWAHGGLSLDKDVCKLVIGPYTMHFTGYQPERTEAQEFCEDIPETGRTVVVLDYIEDQLRSMPTEVRIIRDTGNETNLDAVTVLHVPPKVYPNGSVSFEHNFEAPGKFVGLVTVGEGAAKVESRFPFSVSMSDKFYRYAGYAGAVLAIIGALVFFFRRRGKKTSNEAA